MQADIEDLEVFFMVSFWNRNREARRSREKKQTYRHILLHVIL